MSETESFIRVLFDSLTSLERPEDQQTFLNYVGNKDSSVRERLERLIALRHQARDFFDVESSRTDYVDQQDTTDNGTEGVGSRIGRYQLIERIGDGGCGAVYLAEQLEPIKRRVALKIIRLGMDTENVIARFETERQALAMMEHPNIARVLDCGATHTGRPFFVMQLVDGEKITDYCDTKRLAVSARLRLFIRICQAIQHAHQKGVIHRDIKPSNILVWVHDGEAVPKVIDFGIAKATGGALEENRTFTAAGQFVGTPAYMSPEQAAGSGMDVDTRSDIFSLGALLYELLAGIPPFDPVALRAASVDEIQRILRDVEPSPPSAAVLDSETAGEIANRRGTETHKLSSLLKGDLDRIVGKAMSKDRTRRYATAEALSVDVMRYLNNEPVTARSPSRLYQLQKTVRRNRVAFTAGALIFLSLLLGLGVSTWMFIQATHAREAAEVARANEAELRHKAETDQKIVHAAVLVKYGRIEEADALLAEIPPLEARPSLESGETFRIVGDWHAKGGRWKEAGMRFMAFAHSVTGVDETDSDQVSHVLLPAAACLCETGMREDYEKLRRKAAEGFGGTSNPVVAEQIAKVCLILPADRVLLGKLNPMESLMQASYVKAGFPLTPAERNLVAWRAFSVGLVRFRQGDFQKSLEWMDRAMEPSPRNPAREAMVLSLRSMISLQKGQTAAADEDLANAKDIVGAAFGPPLRIFVRSEPQWPDWLIARILIREAQSTIENGPEAGK